MCSGRPLVYRSGQFNDTKSTTSALILDETTVPPNRRADCRDFRREKRSRQGRQLQVRILSAPGLMMQHDAKGHTTKHRARFHRKTPKIDCSMDLPTVGMAERKPRLLSSVSKAFTYRYGS